MAIRIARLVATLGAATAPRPAAAQISSRNVSSCAADRTLSANQYSFTCLDTARPRAVSADEAPGVLAVRDSAVSPGARSSHCISVAGNYLYALGGEVVARTPIDSRVWRRQLTPGDGGSGAPSPTAGAWEVVPEATAEGPSPRIAHAQAIIGDDLWVFGGREGITMEERPLNDLWRFSLTDRTWSLVGDTLGSPPAPRSFHKATSVGTSLFVFGGCGASGRLADLHRFDTKSGAWELLAEAPEDLPGRGGAGFVASADGGSLFVVGGFAGRETNNVHRFDLDKRRWTTVHEDGNGLIHPFSVSAGATLAGQNRIVFFGGEVGESSRGHEGAGKFGDHMLMLDGTTGEFQGTDAAVMAVDGAQDRAPARGWSSAAAWGSDKLIVFGGLAGNDTKPLRLADTWVIEI